MTIGWKTGSTCGAQSRRIWMAHCCQCGLGVEEVADEPPVDYLCDDCFEESDDE